MVGPVCDLELDVGFETRIQESEAESKLSMSGGSGMLGTFLLRKRLTTVTGNMVLNLITEMAAIEQERERKEERKKGKPKKKRKLIDMNKGRKKVFLH